MLVGYARTSTTDQKAGLVAQERDLRAAGAEKVFTEQVSSVAQRGGLKACLEFMREGDALVVTKPDRLARSCLQSRRTCPGGVSDCWSSRWAANGSTRGTPRAS